MRSTPWLLLLLVLVGCRSAAPVASISDERRQRHLDSFDQIWTTVQQQHWDPALNGVDWAGAKDELRPKVASARTDREARQAMISLIGKLKQSHFAIIPAEVYARLSRTEPKDESGSPSTEPAGEGDAGAHVRVVNGSAIITRVQPGGPAAQAGVEPGWELIRVNRQRVSELLKNIRAAHQGSTLLPTYESLGCQGLLSGDVGETVQAEFRDGRGRRVTKSLTLRPPAGTPSRFMNLPTMYTTFESRELPGNIGYIAFSAFLEPQNVGIGFKQAVERFEHADGMIIDLRGNPGGLGFMANGMAGYLVDQPNLKLGEMKMRSMQLQFVINPQPTVYRGPLAVLVDECSMSTSEILAGGLQDLGRARIFGTPTPGAALPSRIEKLPNGDGFQYAFANYTSAKGQVLEGTGVKPDEVVVPLREQLLAGRDPVIDAAVRWIGTHRRTQYNQQSASAPQLFPR